MMENLMVKKLFLFHSVTKLFLRNPLSAAHYRRKKNRIYFSQPTVLAGCYPLTKGIIEWSTVETLTAFLQAPVFSRLTVSALLFYQTRMDHSSLQLSEM